MRVVVADASRRRPVLSEALRDSGIRVVGETADGAEALEMIRTNRPQVALVNDRIPGMHGAAVAAAVHRDGLPTRVLILTDHPPHAGADKGVAGWMPNEATRAEIIEAVLLCAEGSSGGLVTTDRSECRFSLNLAQCGLFVFPWRASPFAGVHSPQR